MLNLVKLALIFAAQLATRSPIWTAESLTGNFWTIVFSSSGRSLNSPRARSELTLLLLGCFSCYVGQFVCLFALACALLICGKKDGFGAEIFLFVPVILILELFLFTLLIHAIFSLPSALAFCSL